jgi:hypothetical protein
MYGKEQSPASLLYQKVYQYTTDRLKLVEFYESEEGQEISKNRKVSIESLFEIVKMFD